MVERQPNRPSEQEFIGAALRFLADDYKPEKVYISNGYFVHVHEVPLGRSIDENILRLEYLAEGLSGVQESIRDFAIRQLAAYQKLRNS